MLRTLLYKFILVIMPFMAHAQMTPIEQMPKGQYVLDKNHASLTWKVSHLGLSNYTARFTKLDATIEFDPMDITKSTLTATVDPMSIETDFPKPEEKDFDSELAKGKDWFNAAAFPTISYKSTKLEKTSANTARMQGDLTFLGVTKPLTLNVTFNGAYAKKPFSTDPGLGFSATAVLKRSEWGFNTYIPTLGDDVTLLIETEFNKVK